MKANKNTRVTMPGFTKSSIAQMKAIMESKYGKPEPTDKKKKCR